MGEDPGGVGPPNMLLPLYSGCSLIPGLVSGRLFAVQAGGCGSSGQGPGIQTENGTLG